MSAVELPQEPHCDCAGGKHHHPRVEFKVDGETLVVHTDHLKVSEILDLVGENPEDHYLVQFKPKDATYRDPNENVPLENGAEFCSVYTKETPVS